MGRPGRRRPALLACLALAVAGAPARADDALLLERAVEQVVASQGESGLFAYDFDPLSAEASGEQNIVRQAGAMSALGEYLGQRREPRVEAALRRGLEALGGLSLPTSRGLVQSALERVGVFEVDSGRLERTLGRLGWLHRPEGDGLLVSENGGYRRALAGATALGLVAEVEYRRATGDLRFASLRAAWLRGLRTLHVPGGGLRQHPLSLRRSPYFEGETWLALALLHADFPDDAEVEAFLRELEGTLMPFHEASPSAQFYHWGAMASAERYRETGDLRFAAFAAGQTRWVLGARSPAAVRSHTTCSLVEGLASAYSTFRERPEEVALAEEVRARVALELERNRALQIQPGQDRIPLAEGGMLVAPALARHAGAFLAGPYRPYLRVDLTQHCISAFLKARRYGLD